MRSDENGFTFPELLVVTGIALVLLVIAVVLLRPANYTIDQQNAERRLHLAMLAQGLNAYKATTGAFPADIPGTATMLGSTEAQYQLCSTLVPKYLRDIPLDPTAGLKYKGEAESKEPCNKADVAFLSGYTIQAGSSGAVTLAAPAAQDETIQITLR